MTWSKFHPTFGRLPEKLTISFPIWGLYDTPGESAMYTDLDKFVREHKERGFNCIRFDDAAGLMHDIDGNRRGPVNINPRFFGEYTDPLRQFMVSGDGGQCDFYERLIALCTAAKKYGVYVILSSWYYLHTFWWHPKGDPICKELFDVPIEERFMYFAKFLHYILCELEAKDLDGTIAFAEIFNESDGMSANGGYGNSSKFGDDLLAVTRRKHEEALSWLQEKHPGILFAMDSYTPWTDPRKMPKNMQVYNFHSYFLWKIYDAVLEEHPELVYGKITEADTRRTREGRNPIAPNWLKRAATYSDLDVSKIGDFEKYLEEKLCENYDDYIKAMEEGVANMQNLMENFPEIPVVCGENVSYVASKHLLWEEKSETYWKLAEATIRKHKEAGLWGTVIRTCCGPEDPCWHMCADKLKRLNELFLN